LNKYEAGPVVTKREEMHCNFCAFGECRTRSEQN